MYEKMITIQTNKIGYTCII